MKKTVGSIILWVLAFAASVLFITQQEVTESEDINNNGRDKAEIASGASMVWEWIPSFETDTVLFRVSGGKKAKGLILRFSVSEGDSSIASAEWKAGEEADDPPELSGLFHQGKKYSLLVEASGEGSVKLRGSEDEKGSFYPYLQTKGRTTKRNFLWLYLSLVLALFPLMPVPVNRQS